MLITKPHIAVSSTDPISDKDIMAIGDYVQDEMESFASALVRHIQRRFNASVTAEVDEC